MSNTATCPWCHDTHSVDECEASSIVDTRLSSAGIKSFSDPVVRPAHGTFQDDDMFTVKFVTGVEPKSIQILEAFGIDGYPIPRVNHWTTRVECHRCGNHNEKHVEVIGVPGSLVRSWE